ncbi:hypothetical protein A1O3_04908 [Capronia epimyces CBS 606.96]|uniref:Zn(2)-C6 fungal-type domain-containing protein n=1 Tax=Capronia epimyces CBS 606.96 TaxID=1182542 RepID=W9Y4U1_9EURO|nr:uncharacterized protein A1O3_04908 [Capronia epimyces CBS 606.96]EXJ84241.1 hypothetical protein A1O3_04908 [Capronia epimyces CBS 606.96]
MDKSRPGAPASASRGPSTRPVKRACVDCHARKVKCDGAINGFPCSNCKSASVQCTVAERRKRKRGNSNGHDARQAAHLAESPQARFPEARSHETAEGEGDGEGEGEGSPKPTAPGYEGDFELAKEHLVDFFTQDLQCNPIRARSTYVGSELANLNYLTRQRSANHHVYHYPCSDIYVPRGFRNSQGPATPNLIPKDAFVLPPAHVSDALIADYFASVHPGFPIIDKDKFLAQYHQSKSSPPILLLQAVCLAGSHVTTSFKNVQDLKAAFFRRAKALLDGRYEADRMHVVQAALLLTWFSDGGDDICANAWWWIGVAARTAIGLGMHREVGHSMMPDTDKRIWRMIWWCLVQFDCLVSLFYGRPQSINLDDCDVPPLQPDDFDSSIDPTPAAFVIQHAKLCATISELVRSHFSAKASRLGISRSDALEVVDRALAEWSMHLPPVLRESSTGLMMDTSPWVPLLHLTYNTVLIQFHRTTSHHANSHARIASSDREICADAASNIIKNFQCLREHGALQSCWFWAPSSLFTAMLQISGELKCHNSILALRYREKYDSGLLSLRKLSRHWLFAVSVLRLFQSNANKPAENTAGLNLTSPSSVIANQLEEDSSLTSVSRAEVMSTSTATAVHSTLGQVPPQEMEWVQPPTLGDTSVGSMHLELNRWQNNLNEWQSLYWSDPLANISLEDILGTFPLE